MLREDLRQRLIKEYKNAAEKMLSTNIPPRKLFYFSVLFSETQRVLNWQWDRDHALIHAVTQHAHTQLAAALQSAAASPALPVNWEGLLNRLTEVTQEFAEHYESIEPDNPNREALCEILGKISEISYASTGNGSYLNDKGELPI
jgi:hypothetical protein